jgi:hypothetical protein
MRQAAKPDRPLSMLRPRKPLQVSIKDQLQKTRAPCQLAGQRARARRCDHERLREPKAREVIQEMQWIESRSYANTSCTVTQISINEMKSREMPMVCGVYITFHEASLRFLQ